MSTETTATGWPNLTSWDTTAIFLFNVLSFAASYVLLRVIWKPPSAEQTQRLKDFNSKVESLRREYQSINVNSDAKECIEGDSAGDYSEPWTQTFDLTFVIIMSATFVILCIWTQFQHPELWTNTGFWFEQIPKVALMMLVSLLGGLACRYFCDIDEKGYIITNRRSVFKVNYTRKLQHFAAYLVPLLMSTKAAADIKGPLTLSWGSWFTMLGFLILIKPLRERSTFIMLQFNALDRPEDRPHTLSWIVGGNIIPGCVMIIFFRWLFMATGLSPELTYVFIFITGIGDGFAEPVGIYLGKHKYLCSSIFGDRLYQRSLEGSACVWLSGTIFTTMMYYTFHTAGQFWATMIIIPPLMAWAEAKSPHTLDTPFLMGFGGLALFIIGHLSMSWI